MTDLEYILLFIVSLGIVLFLGNCLGILIRKENRKKFCSGCACVHCCDIGKGVEPDPSCVNPEPFRCCKK